jgi:hypothetical protein
MLALPVSASIARFSLREVLSVAATRTLRRDRRLYASTIQRYDDRPFDNFCPALLCNFPVTELRDIVCKLCHAGRTKFSKWR